MNLENEINAVSSCAFNFALEDNDSERNHEEVEPCLRKADALRIAQELCEEQRRMDVFFISKSNLTLAEMLRILPLATGEKK